MNSIINDICSSINNRDIAINIWLLLLFLISLKSKDIRKSYAHIAKLFVKMQVFWILPLYTVLACWFLYTFSLWDFTFFKATSYWFILTAITTFFHLEKLENDDELKKMILGELGLVFLLTLIMNTYTFNIWIELILLPIALIIVMLDVLTSTKEEHKDVHKLIRFVNALIGFTVFGGAIHKLVNLPGTLFSITTFKGILLPIFLFILHLPFFYIISIYSTYQMAVIRISFKGPWKEKKPIYPRFKIYWVLFKKFGFSVSKLREAQFIFPYKNYNGLCECIDKYELRNKNDH